MTTAADMTYDPFDPELIQDPHPFYHRIRQLAPVFPSSMSSDMWMVSDEAAKVYVVTRYDDLAYVLEHPELFPSGNKTGPEDPPEVTEELARGIPKAKTLYDSDQPGHTRLRTLMQGAWSSQRVEQFAPRIRDWAGKAIDGFAGTGSAELFAEYADVVMDHAILDFLGIPSEDHEQVHAWDKLWVKVFIPGHPPEDQRAAAREIVEYQRYLERLFNDRRENPRDDVASALVHATTDDGDRLTMAELVWGLMEMYGAGYGNTAEGLANMLFLLLHEPQRWEELLQQRELLADAVEEGLRMEGPVQWLSREAAQDTELGGVTIPKGSTVMVLYSAANRDPEAFPEPDEFCPARRGATRTGAKHVAHGRGIHYCVGAGWSRVAIRAGVEALMDRLPDVRLRADFTPEFHLPEPMVRCVKALPAVWQPS
ncbi:cytochrome P450 [Micromonospora sonneratiae]|uniref:Cytochrome P450 n=1 Tax=Micromonospora sonneratiae TaxID=1184706 RepID=A0ABW3YDR4_9ACTN